MPAKSHAIFLRAAADAELIRCSLPAFLRHFSPPPSLHFRYVSAFVSMSFCSGASASIILPTVRHGRKRCGVNHARQGGAYTMLV